MKTKGQISIFVILGLVLAAIIIGIAFFRAEIYSKLGEVGIVKEAALPSQVENIKNEIQSCLQYLGEDTVLLVGMQGGYVKLDSRTKYSTVFINILSDPTFPYQGTAYLYDKGQKKVPSLESIEKGMEDYINENVKQCQKEYTGFKVEYDTRVQPEVEIQEKKVNFNVAWNIEVSKDESEYKIRDFKFDVPVRLGEIYNIVNKIVDQQVALKSKDVCASCLTDISAENDITIEVQGIEEDTIYLLTDEQSKLLEGPYIFIMANKF